MNKSHKFYFTGTVNLFNSPAFAPGFLLLLCDQARFRKGTSWVNSVLSYLPLPHLSRCYGVPSVCRTPQPLCSSCSYFSGTAHKEDATKNQAATFCCCSSRKQPALSYHTTEWIQPSVLSPSVTMCKMRMFHSQSVYGTKWCEADAACMKYNETKT